MAVATPLSRMDPAGIITAVLVAVAVAGGVAVAVAVPVAVAVAVSNRTPFNADVVATAGSIV